MTREKFAEKIGWATIAWIGGVINVGAMLPQFWSLVSTHETAGLAVEMLWIYLLTQTIFALQVFFRRDPMLMWCLGLSGGITTINIVLIYWYRSVSG